MYTNMNARGSKSDMQSVTSEGFVLPIPPLLIKHDFPTILAYASFNVAVKGCVRSRVQLSKLYYALSKFIFITITTPIRLIITQEALK